MTTRGVVVRVGVLAVLATHDCFPVLRLWRQEDLGFKASLGI